MGVVFLLICFTMLISCKNQKSEYTLSTTISPATETKAETHSNGNPFFPEAETATATVMKDLNAVLATLEAAAKNSGIAIDPKSYYIPDIIKRVQTTTAFSVYPTSRTAIEYQFENPLLSQVSGITYEGVLADISFIGDTKQALFAEAPETLLLKDAKSYVYNGDEYLFLIRAKNDNGGAAFVLYRTLATVPESENILCFVMGGINPTTLSGQALAEAVYLDFELHPLAR